MPRTFWEEMEKQKRPKEKNDTITLSCRIDGTLHDLLVKDSKGQGISLNSLINSILKRYISWERYAAEIGFVPLARDTVRLIFDELDDQKLHHIANHLGRTIPRELIMLMFNKIDVNSIVAFLELTGSRYGTVQHQVNGESHDLLVHHRISEKFSRFLAEGAKAMADDLHFDLTIKHIDKNMLCLSIKRDYREEYV